MINYKRDMEQNNCLIDIQFQFRQIYFRSQYQKLVMSQFKNNKQPL